MWTPSPVSAEIDAFGVGVMDRCGSDGEEADGAAGVSFFGFELTLEIEIQGAVIRERLGGEDLDAGIIGAERGSEGEQGRAWLPGAGGEPVEVA